MSEAENTPLNWEKRGEIAVLTITRPQAMNSFDLEPFVLALTDPAEYAILYPDLDPIKRGDIDDDGDLDFFDVDPFLELLFP